MSTNTPNYGLNKPEENDFYDVNVQNSNLDAIDQALKDNSDGIAQNSDLIGDNSDEIDLLSLGVEANAVAIGDNEEATGENALEIVKQNDYSSQMKSGIDLSSADYALGSGDYYKGLLVVNVAHETNALILPSVNNHRYDIYNADSQNAALVKRAGGTPIVIPPLKLYRFAFDGTEYQYSPDVDASALIFKPSAVKTGVVDLTLVKWNATNDEWEGSDVGYLVYYDGNLYGNGSMIPITGHSGDDGKIAYSSIAGIISDNASSVVVGAFCEGGSYLNVCINRLVNIDVYKNAAFTIASEHKNAFIRVFVTSNVAVTIPANVNDPIPINTDITLMQYGTGTFTLTPASGVSLCSKESNKKSDGRYSAVTIRKIAADIWIAVGALTS